MNGGAWAVVALLGLGACVGGEGGVDGGVTDAGGRGGTAGGGGGAVGPDSGAAGPVLTSSAFVDGGTLPAEYTCDGQGHSPPLSWTAGPAGTVGYALLMHTDAKDGRKWSWVLYGIPAGTTALTAGETGVGTAGKTSDGPQLAYAPPCSQGPGEKLYTFTVYALSGAPSFPVPASQVTGPVLESAMAGKVLGQGVLTVGYTRP